MLIAYGDRFLFRAVVLSGRRLPVCSAREGVCFLHVPPSCRLRPGDTGWFAELAQVSRQAPDGVDYPNDGQRFAGSTLDPSGICRLRAVLRPFQPSRLELQTIHDHVKRLQQHFIDRLRRLDRPLLNAEKLLYQAGAVHGHFLTFQLSFAEAASGIASRSKEQSVYVDHRGSRLCFGFGLYHDLDDVEELFRRLRRWHGSVSESMAYGTSQETPDPTRSAGKFGWAAIWRIAKNSRFAAVRANPCSRRLFPCHGDSNDGKIACELHRVRGAIFDVREHPNRNVSEENSMRFRMVRALAFILLLSPLGGMVQAEVALKDKSEILGIWLLESVAPGLEKSRIPENRTWEFRADGVLVTSGYNRHFGRDDTQQFKYQIVNGKIQADFPGRPGKTLDYAVYERSGDTMILQGGLEGFYFFKKK